MRAPLFRLKWASEALDAERMLYRSLHHLVVRCLKLACDVNFSSQSKTESFEKGISKNLRIKLYTWIGIFLFIYVFIYLV